MVGKRCQQNEETGLVGERQWDNERAHSFSVCFPPGEAGGQCESSGGRSKTCSLFSCRRPPVVNLSARCSATFCTFRGRCSDCSFSHLLRTHTHPHTPGRDGGRPLVSESAALGSTQPLPRSLKGDRRRCGGWAGRTRPPRQTC